MGVNTVEKRLGRVLSKVQTEAIAFGATGGGIMRKLAWGPGGYKVESISGGLE